MIQASWLRAAGAILLLAIGLSGCGGATETAEPQPSPAAVVSTPEETGATDSTQGAEPTQTDTPESVDTVAYVPWGPDDPVIPQHYGELARRDCAAAQSSSPGGAFWDAVIAVCRTLNQGQPWPDQTEAPAPPPNDNPHDQCLDAELEEMVSAALAWRAENGDGIPQVTYADSGSPCYERVYAVRQVPAQEDPRTQDVGRVTVAVVLDSTYSLTSVSVDGAQVSSDDYVDSGNDPQPGMRTVTVDLPAPDSPTTVTLDLALDQDGSDRGTVSASVEVAPTTGGGPSDGPDEQPTEDSSEATPTDAP